MTEDTRKARPTRRWYQFSLRTLLLATTVFAILLSLVVHYWPHLWWKLNLSKGPLGEVQRVPTRPMPAADTPARWAHCRFGSLEFDVPLELANGFEPAGNDSGGGVLDDGTTTILMVLPSSAEVEREMLDKATAPFPELNELSVGRLIVKTHEVSSDDFRWSMSRHEVLQHTCLLALAKLTDGMDSEVETLFRDDIEGHLALHADSNVAFQWWTTDSRAGTYMWFKRAPGKVDLGFVRAVCRSLKFSGECYPESIPDEEVPELFEIMEVVGPDRNGS